MRANAGVAGGCVALALLLVFLITRSVRKPMNEALEASNRLAEGDLTTHITGGRRG